MKAIPRSLAALAIAAAVTACSQGTSPLVPTKPYSGQVNAALAMTEVVRIDVNGRFVCPIVEHEGIEALLVLPVDATGTIEPVPSFTVGGYTVKAGETFSGPALASYDGSLDCGGTRYEHVVVLHSPDIGQPE